jgi:hypothetical protein
MQTGKLAIWQSGNLKNNNIQQRNGWSNLREAQTQQSEYALTEDSDYDGLFYGIESRQRNLVVGGVR